MFKNNSNSYVHVTECLMLILKYVLCFLGFAGWLKYWRYYFFVVIVTQSVFCGLRTELRSSIRVFTFYVVYIIFSIVSSEKRLRNALVVELLTSLTDLCGYFMLWLSALWKVFRGSWCDSTALRSSDKIKFDTSYVASGYFAFMTALYFSLSTVHFYYLIAFCLL